jgi:dolichyl-diphosphooligosaccharide--protein glycosyltransferase
MDHGYGADTVKNGTKWNTHLLAPLGQAQPFTELHPLLAAYLGQGLANITDVSPYMVFFTLPAIIASLATIPTYFLGRRFGGRLGGFIAAAITATHQLFVSRSVAGFSDTDAYNITLPLFIFWFTVKAFDAETTKTKSLWSALALGSLGLLVKTWLAWWLTYVLLLVTAGSVLVHYLLRRAWEAYQNQQTVDEYFDELSWPLPVTALVLSIGGAIVAGLIRGFDTITGLIGTILDNVAINEAVKANLWPNVFTTVAELGNTTFTGMIGSLGNSLFFFVALLSTILLFLPSKIQTAMQKRVYYTWAGASAAFFALPFLFSMSVASSLVFFAVPILAGYTITIFETKERVDVAFPVFLSAWIIALLFAGPKGTRFVMILLPAYAIALGTSIGWAFRGLTRYATNAESRDAKYSTGLLAVIVLLIGLSIPLSTQAQGWQAGQRLPSMNDAWYDSLERIQNESDDDAIITSWWDFGHWFKQVADRPVTFDGSTQNTPNAHWVGKALQTSDEDEATSILRMLHCGNRKGFDQLRSSLHGENTPESYEDTKDVLDKALTINDQEEATSLYERQGLSGEEARDVANLTHCETPENYLITSNDMVGKASVWGHFGLWDFDKAYAVQTHDDTSPQETIRRYTDHLNISEEQARSYYLDIPDLSTQQERNQWVADYPRYATQGMQSCESTNQSITCELNIELGRQGRGQELRLDSVTAPNNDFADASFIVGVYDSQTGFRQGQREFTPGSVSVGSGEDITTVTTTNTSQLDLGVLFHRGDNGWETLLASPELTESMFTRLYFLDGAYTDEFELVNEERSNVAGNQIKVWTRN